MMNTLLVIVGCYSPLLTRIRHCREITMALEAAHLLMMQGPEYCCLKGLCDGRKKVKSAATKVKHHSANRNRRGEQMRFASYRWDVSLSLRPYLVSNHYSLLTSIHHY